MKPDTLAWFAAHNGVAPVEFEARLRIHAAPTLAAPELDLRAALRDGPLVGVGAGAVRTIRRLPFVLVVSLPRLRVWVPRGDTWARAERAMQRDPVVYEVFARPTGPRVTPEAAAVETWIAATAGEVPVGLFEQMARALWAAHAACSAPMQQSA